MSFNGKSNEETLSQKAASRRRAREARAEWLKLPEPPVPPTRIAGKVWELPDGTVSRTLSADEIIHIYDNYTSELSIPLAVEGTLIFALAILGSIVALAFMPVAFIPMFGLSVFNAILAGEIDKHNFNTKTMGGETPKTAKLFKNLLFITITLVAICGFYIVLSTGGISGFLSGLWWFVGCYLITPAAGIINRINKSTADFIWQNFGYSMYETRANFAKRMAEMGATERDETDDDFSDYKDGDLYLKHSINKGV